MSTIPTTPVDATKPQTGNNPPPSTADQRTAHANINAAFTAANTDVTALETGKEDVGVAASEVAAHEASVTAHGSVEANFGTHTTGQTNTHAQLDAHVASTANPHAVTAAQAGAEPSGSIATHDASGAAHGGVEAAFAAHDGAGGAAHQAFGTVSAGFAPASGGGTVNYLRADGTWTEPPGGGGGSLTTVRKNTGVDVSTGRARLNFIEGANVTIDISDDATGDEADITITSTAAGGGGGDMLSPVSMAVGELYAAGDTAGVQTAGTGIQATDITDHTGNAAIHFTVASIDHTAITNIGSNSHAQIDTHIGTAGIHFTEASIVHNNISGLTTGDPHTQYHNDARGDARYTPLSHVGQGGAQHATFTNIANGFAPLSGGGTVNYLRADGQWVQPPGIGQNNVSTTPATVGANEADINMAKVGSDLQKRKLVGGTNVTLTEGADAITIAAAAGGSVTNPPAVKGDLWSFDLGLGDTQRLPAGTSSQILKPDAVADIGLKWENILGASATGSTIVESQSNGAINDSGVAISTLARLNLAADFTVSLAEQGVGTVYQAAATAETTSWTPTLSAGNTPRRYTNGALTVNAPTGDGDAVLVLGTGASLTLNGAYTVLGARDAAKVQTCYVSNDATNTVTVFAYGSASA